MPADIRNNDGAVREIPLPDDARQRSTLDRLDYTDGFVVDITGCRHLTAEQWARAVLEGAPPSFRRTAPWAWRALGLERGPLSSDHSILSWPIKQRSQDVILLSAQGRLGMSGELLLEVHGDHLRFGTMLELRTWFARARSGHASKRHIAGSWLGCWDRRGVTSSREETDWADAPSTRSRKVSARHHRIRRDQPVTEPPPV